jgi:hypothetical protein
MSDDKQPEAAATPTRAAGATPWQGDLPLLYKKPELLNAERHKKAGIKEGTDFGFARDTNSVPLAANELFAAQFDFPVVFTESNPPLPVAVLGVGGSRNVFIDAQGAWRSNTYIPAYIRRYPFILATGLTPGQVHVAIDEGAACFGVEEGQRLFEDDGNPSGFTRGAVEFCRAFQAQFEVARAFGEALESAGLLMPRRVDIQQPDGTRMSLDRFRLIDEARFDALPDATFLAWRRRGWLGLIYAHFLSMRRWQGFAAPTVTN